MEKNRVSGEYVSLFHEANDEIYTKHHEVETKESKNRVERKR